MELITGSNGATWESRMPSPRSCWCRPSFLASTICPLSGSKVTPARLLEAVLLGVSILTVGFFAFDHLPAGPDTSPALLYAPIPLLIWAALRFGLGGMSASMLVITFQAIWGTMHGRGPFLMQTPAENALALQMFLLFTATPLMFLAVIIEEERRSQHALRESEARFRHHGRCGPGHDLDGGQGQAVRLLQPTLARLHRPHAGTGVGHRLGSRTSARQDSRSWFERLHKFFRRTAGIPGGIPPAEEVMAHMDGFWIRVSRVMPKTASLRGWLQAARALASPSAGGGGRVRFHIEYRVVLPDGSLRWFSRSGRVKARLNRDAGANAGRVH